MKEILVALAVLFFLSGCTEQIAQFDDCYVGIKNIDKLDRLRINYVSAMQISDFDTAEQSYYEFINEAQITNTTIGKYCTLEQYPEKNRGGLVKWENEVATSMADGLRTGKAIQIFSKFVI